MAETPRSLRQRLLRRLLPGLVLLITLGAAFSYFLALGFANQAYDRWLLDSARSLATQVKKQDGKPVFDLGPQAYEVFEWDELDKTYYRVASAAGAVIAGYADLPVPAGTRDEPLFFDTPYRGGTVRGVRIQVTLGDGVEPVTVAVAETQGKRRVLAEEILPVVLIPQLLLTLLVIWRVWSGVRSGLDSLGSVTRQLARKGHRDLSPLSAEQVPEELRPVVARMNELLARLRHAMESQRNFVAEAAHQLRTPLAGLKLQSENLLRTPTPPDTRESIELLKQTADRAVHLGNQLLTLARAEPQFDATRDFAPVDLVEVARDAGAQWIPRALDAGVDVALHAPDDAVIIPGDATMLGELVSNLVENAVRYGGSPGSVNITVGTGRAPWIAVEDNGPGIPPDKVERVFDRFYRMPDAVHTGSGLGLAIVREIAELHGGSVRIESVPAFAGTRVRVEFGAPRK